MLYDMAERRRELAQRIMTAAFDGHRDAEPVVVIAERRWAWMLYEDDGRLVLCVVCGSVALYELAIELRADEVESYRAGGDAAVDQLARQVSDEPRKYWTRRIHSFNDEPSVREATTNWRSQH